MKRVRSLATSSLTELRGATAEKIAAKIGMRQVIGIVPFSSSVQEKGLAGEALDDSSVNIIDITSFILGKLNEKR